MFLLPVFLVSYLRILCQSEGHENLPISPQVLVFIAIFSCIFSQFFIWYEVRGPMNLIISSVLRKLGSCIYKCLGNTMLTSFSIHKHEIFSHLDLHNFKCFSLPILSVISKYYAPSLTSGIVWWNSTPFWCKTLHVLYVTC